MAGRKVQIRSRLLAWPWGAIVSQEELGQSDAALDKFIAAGYAIEHEADDPAPSRQPAPLVNPAPTADEAFPDSLIESTPAPKRKRKPSGSGNA